MSYTYPPNLELEFTFSGDVFSVGTPNFLWLSSGELVFAEGFSHTEFGSYFALVEQIVDASGAQLTEFGSPTSRLTQPANGFGTPVLFGDANSLFAVYAIGLHIDVNFGTFTSPYLQECSVDGLVSTRFGLNFANLYTPPLINRSVSARSWKASVFGVATGWTQTTQQADGFFLTGYGTPSIRITQLASAVALGTNFSSPSVATALRAVGWRSSSVETPSLKRTQMATSLSAFPRWGAHRYVRSNAHLLRGFRIYARFGQPQARLLLARAATGLAGTSFGAPACTQRYRAFHIPPESRFSKPRLIRSFAC